MSLIKQQISTQMLLQIQKEMEVQRQLQGLNSHLQMLLEQRQQQWPLITTIIPLIIINNGDFNLIVKEIQLNMEKILLIIPILVLQVLEDQQVKVKLKHNHPLMDQQHQLKENWVVLQEIIFLISLHLLITHGVNKKIQMVTHKQL